MQKRRAQSCVRPSPRGLRGFLVAACLGAPFALAADEAPVKVQVQVQAVEAVPVPAPAPAPAAVKIGVGAAPAAPAKPDGAKKEDEKPASVDPALEKEIEKLAKELEGLKKGTTDYDLKNAALMRKKAELQMKVRADQQKKQQEQAQAQAMAQIATGATLDTDSEVDMLLDRAKEYAGEGRYRDACVLWQHILDQKPGLTDRQPTEADPKATRKGGAVIFRPVRDLVEMELAALPPDGLHEYRIEADANARAALAAAEQSNDSGAGLAEVVRRYFTSSLGDDAAYRLACIQMDEWDFISARRLLEKVVTRHPDPSIPRSELLLRLALASAKAGDSSGAAVALRNLDEATKKQPLPEELLNVVRQVVDAGAAVLAAAGPVHGWPMSLGAATRDGIMAGAPGEPVKGDALWIDQQLPSTQKDAGPTAPTFEFKVPDLVSKNQMMVGQQQNPQGRQEIVSRWEKGGWNPTTQVLLRDGIAFFKTHNELRWYDLKTRKLIETLAQPTPKLESGARIWNQNYYYGPQKPETPSTTEEVALFGDRVAKSMSIIGDTLFHIEGRVWSGGPNSRMMVFVNNRQSALQITEQLCAVDITDAGKGKRVKWRYPVEADAQSDLRFLAPPVPSGNRLLVPVMRNGELVLLGLDAATGTQAWSTLLCLPPSADDGNRWAPVGVSIVGSEAYVASGYGVVFAVDAGAGNIIWATRYKRSDVAQQPGQMIGFGARMRVDLPGWSEDVVIPRGDKLIVLPSDGDQVICFSRLSGKQLWTSPRDKATYALGVLGDSLYVAGKNAVRRYGIHSGRLEKNEALKFETFARGALTPEGIYLPTKTEIVRLDPQTLAQVGRLKIASGSKDPVGNLFCDGKHLVAAGLDRVYALSDGDIKMKELTESIAKADSGPLRVERAFLYEVLGRTNAAVEDLRVAFKLLPAGVDREAAGRKLMLGLLDMAKSDAANTVALFEEAEKVSEPLKMQVRVWLARGGYHVSQGDAMAGLNLFLKAAQDTSDALVLVDDEDGRREARAALAAGAEIRALVQATPDLAEELARRGESALKPHLELAALEKQVEGGNTALPQAGEVTKLEAEVTKLSADQKAAQAKADAIAKERKQIEFQLGVEETTPTGKLEALKKQLAENDARLKPAAELALTLKQTTEAKQKEIDSTRALMASLSQRLAELKANRVLHADRLLALGELYPGSTVQLKAHVLAARYLWNENLFERSELILRDLAASPNRAIAAAGAVALAQSYQAKGWHRQAHHAWQKVKRDFADALVEQAGKQVNAADLAQAALVGIKITGDANLAVDRRMPDPPYEKAWSLQTNGQYILETDNDDPSQFLEDHLITLATGNSKIICKNVETGADVWHLSLTQSNFSGSSTTNGRIVQFNNYNFPSGRLVRQGHVALLAAPDRIMGFGLASGQKLWEVAALQLPDRQNRYGYYYGHMNPMQPIAIGCGVVADFGMTQDRGEIAVRALDAQTGKVRWITELKNDNVAGLAAAMDCVFVFVNNGAEMVICDATTGRRTGRIKFENRQPQFPISWTKHGMLAINMQKATLYELPSGKEKWSTPIVSNKGGMVFSGYQRIDAIDDNRVCVLNGGLFVLDLKEKKQIAEASGTDLGGRYINDAAASPDGKEIIAIGYGNQGEQTINVVDTATGKVKAAINLGPRVGQQIQAGKVAAAGDLLPVLINDPPKDMGGGRKQYTNNATIAFFRKSDGQRVDVKLPGGDAAMRIQNAQSPIVRGNVFMVLTYQGLTAYRRTPGAPVEQLKNYVEPPAPKPDEKKDDKKGAGVQPGLPQLLPIPVPLPAARRIIIEGGKIQIDGKEIPIEKKKDEKKEERKDDKKGADAGKAGAAVIGGGGVIQVEGNAEVIVDIDAIIVGEAPVVEKKEPAKKDQAEKKE